MMKGTDALLDLHRAPGRSDGGSAARTLFDYPWARDSFVHLGYPSYIIYSLEIA